MKAIMKKLFLICIIILNTHPIHAQLFINEFMASNNQTIADEFGELDDWIELYNDADIDVSLSGFYLTDALSNPTKWPLPDITLSARGFLLIWADEDMTQGIRHANFKLSAAGEQIGIFNGKDFIDSLTFVQQKTDISLGRYPDGKTAWLYLDSPTPGSSNAIQNQPLAQKPSFSPEGGFYNSSLNVKISAASPTAKIYYSLDCSEPASDKIQYVAPIPISRTAVIRAIVLDAGCLPSEIATQTYIFNNDFDIATLSLVTDPPNLWDPNSGIYVYPDERGDDWERPVAMEFFAKDNSLSFRESGGIRIHGKTAQTYAKKPFRLYFRSEYGQSQLNYSLFQTKPFLISFKRLVVHSAGTDMPVNPYSYGWTLIRDPLMQEITRRVGGIYAANQPVALYLNGEPWGIYNLLERIDKYYTESNFGLIDIDLIENGGEAKEGDLDAWDEMHAFFETADLGSDSNFETATTLIDVENFTDYCIIEIFGGNGDWPQNNFLAFRPRQADALWRFIIWDMDGCFGPYGILSNTLEWATRDDASTLILRKFLEHQNCRYFFINRFADLLNTTFLSENVIDLIDSLTAVIQADLSFEIDKWGSSYHEWWNYGIMGELRDFAVQRPRIVRDDLRDYFDLDRTVTVTIDPIEGGQGKIKINTLLISNFPWSGTYFSNTPITLQAIPKPGFRLKEWSEPSLSGDFGEATITLSNDFRVHAILEHDPQPEQIVINEINYSSAADFNPQDWIELYNLKSKAIDLSGWHFKDDYAAHDFIFPDGTYINAYGVLVLCENQMAFSAHFPRVRCYLGDFNFGLSGSGDMARIFDADMNLIDSVQFDNSAPWPAEPDGNGATLELNFPQENNSLPQFWQASPGYGSPGQLNSNESQVDPQKSSSSISQCSFHLAQNYPNPFNPFTTISFSIPAKQKVTLAIFNTLGQKIITLVDDILPAGHHSVQWQAEEMPSGLYFYQIKSGSYIATKKMILLR
jgi:hypothetical protein